MLSVFQVQSALSLGVAASLAAIVLLGRAKLSANLVLVVVGVFAAVKMVILLLFVLSKLL